MLKLAVVSDTHLSSPDSLLVQQVENGFSHFDAVLHCGDFINESVWSYLGQSHADFHAVRGNMDSLNWSHFLPEKKIITFEQVTAGILHGHDIDLWNRPQSLLEAFDEQVDLICFGHTHIREWLQADNGVHVVNPGSFRLPKDGLKSYAAIEVNDNKDIHVQWHYI